MERENKKIKNENIIKLVKISTIVLLIILVSMIGFLGIYSQNKNKMANKVKDYTYAMDIKGARTIKLKLNTGTTDVVKDTEGNIIEKATDEEIEKNGYTKEAVPNNSEEAKTEENYRKSKELIEKRLKELDVQNYNISLNEKTGEMIIEVPENSSTDTVVNRLNTVGKFEIIDTETKEVLIDNSSIKSSSVLYNTSTAGTTAYLEIAFNKEGKKKLEEISKTYIETEDNNTTAENTTTENTTNTEGNNETTEDTKNETKKTITMKVDNEEVMTTSFDEPITTGKIQLSVGTATKDGSTLQDYITQAQNIAVVLDSGNLPLKYDIEKNQYILSDMTEQKLEYIEISVIVIISIGIIILITKFKFKGLLTGISYIGAVALYLILIRYTNTIISIESIFGITTVLILNYIFTFILLKNINNNEKENKENIVNKATIETYIKFFIRITPICIIAIVACFIKWIPMSSFGMTLFWGLVTIAVYNSLITRFLLKTSIEDK